MRDNYRALYDQYKLPIGRFFLRLNIKPNTWTLIGLFVSIGAGYSLSRGLFILTLLLIFILIFIDMIDGAVATASGNATIFGSILDHVVDRYGELFIILGAQLSGQVNAIIATFAFAGMVMASYTRAKVESSSNVKCTMGAGRLEKLLILQFALLLASLGWGFHAIDAGLGIIGLLSTITALRRLNYAYKVLSKPKDYLSID